MQKEAHTALQACSQTRDWAHPGTAPCAASCMHQAPWLPLCHLAANSNLAQPAIPQTDSNDDDDDDDDRCVQTGKGRSANHGHLVSSRTGGPTVSGCSTLRPRSSLPCTASCGAPHEQVHVGTYESSSFMSAAMSAAAVLGSRHDSQHTTFFMHLAQPAMQTCCSARKHARCMTSMIGRGPYYSLPHLSPNVRPRNTMACHTAKPNAAIAPSLHHNTATGKALKAATRGGLGDARLRSRLLKQPQNLHSERWGGSCQAPTHRQQSGQRVP